jgi:DNA-binding response OmpR family regulator
MRRPLILVVDDEVDVRELVEVVLDSSGYDVQTAVDGDEALRQLHARTYDAVVLDVSMPVLDGWAVLETMKADTDPAVSEVPVVMLTAMGTTADKLRGGLDGALHYITKPFDVSQLITVLDDVFAADAPPEPVRRRRVQQSTLEKVVRLESGASVPLGAEPRVHLTKLESNAPPALAPSRRLVDARQRLGSLSNGQLRLLERLARSDSVTSVADELGVSRSNIYASLRRICRRLNVRGAAELLDLVRSGDLLG